MHGHHDCAACWLQHMQRHWGRPCRAWRAVAGTAAVRSVCIVPCIVVPVLLRYPRAAGGCPASAASRKALCWAASTCTTRANAHLQLSMPTVCSMAWHLLLDCRQAVQTHLGFLCINMAELSPAQVPASYRVVQPGSHWRYAGEHILCRCQGLPPVVAAVQDVAATGGQDAHSAA